MPTLCEDRRLRIAWMGLCFLMEPTISQSAASHARRIASDVLAGRNSTLFCYVASWILVSVGVAFRPRERSEQRGEPRGGAGRFLKTTVAIVVGFDVYVRYRNSRNRTAGASTRETGPSQRSIGLT